MKAPTLVFLLGPPAVGKMTVRHELAQRTGFRLFHNHQTIDLVLRFFDFGTPPFHRLVGEFRRRIFEEVAASDLAGLIFTYEVEEVARRIIARFALPESPPGPGRS